MDSHLHYSNSRQWSFLPIVFLVSILGGIVAHHVASYFVPQQQATEWMSPTTHLEVRDVLLERGLGDVLSNLGSSALSSIENGISSLLPNASSIIGSLTAGLNGSSLIDSLQEPAKFLGVGLGNGTLMGLGLAGPANATIPSGIDGVAQNLGSGLTSSIFSSSSIKSLLSASTTSGASGMIGQAALALAQGLGGGAASGLKSTTISSKGVADTQAGTQTGVVYNTSGLNGVAGNLGLGLSSSFLSGISLSSIASMGSSLLGSTGSSLDISAIGAGLGAGLGQGAAVGLGFQKDVDSPSSQDPAIITQVFAKGLASSFLNNETLSAVIDSFSPSSGNSSVMGLSLSSIDISKAAEGLAVGLISGAGSTISTLQVIGADITSFNDTVGGAATGFGRGLGSEGAKVVEQLLASSSKATKKRNLEEAPGSSPLERSLSLQRREATTTNATNLASVIASLNASAINPIIQTGIDDLSCMGVGGLVGIFLGLVESKTIDLKIITSMATPSTNNSTLNLPDQIFVIKSGGNTYSLNPAKGIMTVLINGMGIYRLVGVAAAHIVFGIMAYFVALPLLLLLINTQKLTMSLDRRQPGAPDSKWQTYLRYSILLVAILTFALGIALTGSAKHFTSAHEILGLIVFLQTLIAAGTTIIFQRQAPGATSSKNLNLVHYGNIGLMLVLSLLTLLFGFTDLSSLSICVTQSILPIPVWIALGWLLLTPLMLAVGLEGLIFWLDWMRGRKPVPVRKDNIVQVKGEKPTMGYMDV